MSEHKEEQFRLILNYLKQNGLGLTRLQTAKLLGLPKTAHIAKLLNELAEHDLVIMKRGVDARRRNVFIYFYNDMKGE